MLTQKQYNLIQFCLGDIMRRIDTKKESLSRIGMRRSDVVGLLRQMGVATDLSPDAMTSHRDTSKLQEVLLQNCHRCMHQRMAHSISSKSKTLDPTLEKISTFLENEESRCLMPLCGCKGFR
jgi:ribosomal protein L32